VAYPNLVGFAATGNLKATSRQPHGNLTAGQHPISNEQKGDACAPPLIKNLSGFDIGPPALIWSTRANLAHPL